VQRILTKLELDNRVQIAVVVRGSRPGWRSRPGMSAAGT